MTLIEPVIVSVLRERHEDAAYAEMEEQYQRFMSLSDDHEATPAVSFAAADRARQLTCPAWSRPRGGLC